jgi:hypothetical protein
MSVLWFSTSESRLWLAVRSLGGATIVPVVAIVVTTVSPIILLLRPVAAMLSVPPPVLVVIPPVLAPILVLSDLGCCSICTSVGVQRQSKLAQAEDENET